MTRAVRSGRCGGDQSPLGRMAVIHGVPVGSWCGVLSVMRPYMSGPCRLCGVTGAPQVALWWMGRIASRWGMNPLAPGEGTRCSHMEMWRATRVPPRRGRTRGWCARGSARLGTWIWPPVRPIPLSSQVVLEARTPPSCQATRGESWRLLRLCERDPLSRTTKIGMGTWPTSRVYPQTLRSPSGEGPRDRMWLETCGWRGLPRPPDRLRRHPSHRSRRLSHCSACSSARLGCCPTYQPPFAQPLGMP